MHYLCQGTKRRWKVWMLLLISVRGFSQERPKDLAQDITTSRDKLGTLEKQENSAHLRYRPVYFIYGNPDTKVQISAKFLLVRTLPLYVAYSQLIFWRLHEESKPFEDATFNPELFYSWSLGKEHLTGVDFGPWSHQSNGKGGESSRSIDESFVRLNSRWDFKDMTLLVSGSGAVQYNRDPVYRDSYKYRGPFEFHISAINFFSSNQIIDKSDLTLRFFPGGKFGQHWQRGGYELGSNIRFGALDVFPTVYLQYYQGFAESMINYNEHVRQFRAGVSF